MGRAIWSAEAAAMLDFPARFLSTSSTPRFPVGGPASRLADSARRLAHVRRRVARGCAHRPATRDTGGLDPATPRRRACPHRRGDVEGYDQRLLACHSDQALRLLEAPTAAELEVLRAFPYASNEVILHTDQRLLPRRTLARAAWNYHLLADPQEPVAVTYDMNVLQALEAPVRFLVTLNNRAAIDERRCCARSATTIPSTPRGRSPRSGGIGS